jgi:PAP2 superfamily
VARLRTVVSRHDGLAQVAVVLGAVGAYEAMRLAVRPDWPLALEHAREVAGWERVAHLAWEAPLQRLLLQVPVLVDAINAFYLGAHFAVTGLFFLWLYGRSKPGFRLFRNGFLVATTLALVVAWRFPTAPPRVAGLGLVDTLQRFSGLDIGSPGSGGLSDPVAALPSLHAGWAFGVAAGVLVYARSPAVRALACLYAAAVTLAILVTGNHFVVDALGGALVMALGFGLALLPGRFRVVASKLRRGVEQPGSSPGS